MEGEKVEVKYDDGKWYPATILKEINEEEVEVEYEDPDYDPEIVLICNTRALTVSSNSLPINKSIAGAFNYEHFESFCKEIMRDSEFITPLSIQELDLKSSRLSFHASERIEER